MIMNVETSLVSNTDSILGNVAPIYNQIFGAIIILIVGIILGRLVGILLDKIFREVQLDRAFNLFSRQTYSFGKALSDLVSFIMYLISFIWALIFLDVFNFVVGFILWLLVLVLAGSFVLNSLEFFPNIFSGYALRKRKKGSEKKFDSLNIKGIIENIGFVRTKVVSSLGDEYYIPNKIVLDKLKDK